jgi:hypothetical protein
MSIEAVRGKLVEPRSVSEEKEVQNVWRNDKRK